VPKKAQVLKSRPIRIISGFLQNVPHMPRLHTAVFSEIKVKQEHLALLFQSNSLYHLILSNCILPRSIHLPPSPVRHLTLSLNDNCKHVEPFLGHCSANLEALDFTGHMARPLMSTTLPLFPKLRELKFDGISWSINELEGLIFLAPRLEHLEVYGRRDFVSRVSALPTSIKRLSINQFVIDDGDLDTRLFIRLPHLHIRYYDESDSERTGSIIRIMQRIFPNLTSLDLSIQSGVCSLALLLARHLPNVTQLKLNLHSSARYGPNIRPYLPYFPAPRGPLASLHVNVEYAEKFSIEVYKSWAIHTVLGPDPGLGGPYLREIEMIFSGSKPTVKLLRNGKGGALRSIERNEERVFWVYSHGQISEGPCAGYRDFRYQR
jgi:hypothetical protein